MSEARIGDSPVPKSREEAEEILARIEDPEKREKLRGMLEFFKPWETLDPELRPWVMEGENFTALKHPLLFALPYMPGVQDGQLNEVYRRKKAMRDEYAAAKNFRAIVFVVYERAYRLDALLRYEDQIEDPCEFWDLVGGIWTDSENIHQSYDEWREILHDPRPCRESMMNEGERAELAKLPDTLKIYRGYRSLEGEWDGLDGFSWTLDRPKALWFAKRWQGVHEGETAHVATGTVAKEHVIAYFSGRGEREIVALPEHITITRRQEV